MFLIVEFACLLSSASLGVYLSVVLPPNRQQFLANITSSCFFFFFFFFGVATRGLILLHQQFACSLVFTWLGFANTVHIPNALFIATFTVQSRYISGTLVLIAFAFAELNVTSKLCASFEVILLFFIAKQLERR